MNWISVKTEMPKEEEYVLILAGKNVLEGWWSSSYKSRWRSSRTPSCAPPDAVTHWMPLPEPPNDPS